MSGMAMWVSAGRLGRTGMCAAERELRLIIQRERRERRARARRERRAPRETRRIAAFVAAFTIVFIYVFFM